MSDASQLMLGKSLYGERHRDAIHVAIAPVEVTEEMKPGERVRFVGEGTEKVCKAGEGDAVGIIDPFVRYTVYQGQRYWLFLYPGTITSLRHEWAHPAFGDVTKQASRKWIEEFAVELDQTYNRLIAAAELWIETDDGKWGGEHTYDNSETYKGVHESKWPIFWQHFEILTGKKPRQGGCFYTCSC